MFQENLKALRARDKAAERQNSQKEFEKRQEILNEGGNPDEIMLIQKRYDDLQRQKRYCKIPPKIKIKFCQFSKFLLIKANNFPF